MTKRESSLVGVLVVLTIVSGLIYYFNNRGTSSASTVISVGGDYKPIAIENPSLRMDLLEGLQHVEYKGSHRNIFSGTPPPHVPTPQEIAYNKAHEPPPSQVQPIVQPVQVNLKFYGYIDDPRTG